MHPASTHLACILSHYTLAYTLNTLPHLTRQWHAPCLTSPGMSHTWPHQAYTLPPLTWHMSCLTTHGMHPIHPALPHLAWAILHLIRHAPCLHSSGMHPVSPHWHAPCLTSPSLHPVSTHLACTLSHREHLTSMCHVWPHYACALSDLTRHVHFLTTPSKRPDICHSLWCFSPGNVTMHLLCQNTEAAVCDRWTRTSLSHLKLCF